MIPIFFIDRIIYLSDKIINNSAINHQFTTKEALQDIIADFDNNLSLKSIYIINADIEELLENVKSCFKIVEAAGGLVYNNDGKFLVMKRRGKWDLPKGKMEKGETKEESAVREVQEECGISDIILGEFLLTTYHTYYGKKNFILKPTYWYKMTAPQREELVPQTEEDITEVKWIDESGTQEVYANTFPSIIEVLEKRERP